MAWLRFADSDLRGAQLSLNDEDPPVLHICSSCQQAVEKYLKAYLISRGWRLEKTHSIDYLLKKCTEYDAEFDQFRADLEPFAEYFTEARYPGDLFVEFTLDEARKAVRVTERVSEFVHERIPPPSTE
ncbi:MAG TPA: HEPN domain-containing protein [Blastocatellia bacterium]|nr:HEPN domain-containing protein [Blastocatellia bacterium]